MHDNKRNISTASLLRLPAELLAREVFRYLPLASLIQCLSTCRQINDLITSSTELIYQMELEVAGMKDNPRCSYRTYPLVRRLEMLRERERRWLLFDWEWRREMELPAHCWDTNYDVAPGIYLRGKRRDSVPSTPAGVYYTKLPSNRDENGPWMEVHLGEKAEIYFAASVENDLVACASWVETPASSIHVQVNFVTLSTGLPHPLAAFSILDIRNLNGRLDRFQLCAEICGENFSLSYSTRLKTRGTLNIWNWKTGEKKAETLLGGCSGLRSLVFLREDLLMHANAQGGSLDVFNISQDKVELILSLSLPALAKGCRVDTLQCTSRPSPSFTPNDSVTNSTSRPFFNDPQSTVFLITSDVFHRRSRRHSCFGFLTHRRSLLQLALSACDNAIGPSGAEASSDPQNVVTPLAWEDWGPLMTHIFPLNSHVPCEPYATAGERLVWINRPMPPDYLRVYTLEKADFNQLRIRRLRQASPTPATPEVANVPVMDFVQTVVLPSSDGVFDQDVHSYLPCLRTRHPLGGGPLQDLPVDAIPMREIPGFEFQEILQVFMDEERIIGVYGEMDAFDMKEALDIFYFG